MPSAAYLALNVRELGNTAVDAEAAILCERKMLFTPDLLGIELDLEHGNAPPRHHMR